MEGLYLVFDHVLASLWLLLGAPFLGGWDSVKNLCIRHPTSLLPTPSTRVVVCGGNLWVGRLVGHLESSGLWCRCPLHLFILPNHKSILGRHLFFLLQACHFTTGLLCTPRDPSLHTAAFCHDQQCLSDFLAVPSNENKTVVQMEDACTSFKQEQ